MAIYIASPGVMDFTSHLPHRYNFIVVTASEPKQP